MIITVTVQQDGREKTVNLSSHIAMSISSFAKMVALVRTAPMVIFACVLQVVSVHKFKHNHYFDIELTFTEYSGSNCENIINQCLIKPCLNGGTCNSNGTCTCPTNYTGANCGEIVQDFCTPYPCYNGGTCVQNETDFTCQCSFDFEDRFCEKRNNSFICKNSFCYNRDYCFVEKDPNYNFFFYDLDRTLYAPNPKVQSPVFYIDNTKISSLSICLWVHFWDSVDPMVYLSVVQCVNWKRMTFSNCSFHIICV